MRITILTWNRALGLARQGWAEITDLGPNPWLFQFHYSTRTKKLLCVGKDHTVPTIEVEEAIYRAIRLRLDMEQMGEEDDAATGDLSTSEGDPPSGGEAHQERQAE